MSESYAQYNVRYPSIAFQILNLLLVSDSPIRTSNIVEKVWSPEDYSKSAVYITVKDLLDADMIAKVSDRRRFTDYVIKPDGISYFLKLEADLNIPRKFGWKKASGGS